MTDHLARESYSMEPKEVARQAQQLACLADALNARLSGLAAGAPLTSIREATTLAKAVAKQMSALLLDVVAGAERLLTLAELANGNEDETNGAKS
jgi:hypothetical protein